MDLIFERKNCIFKPIYPSNKVNRTPPSLDLRGTCEFSYAADGFRFDGKRLNFSNHDYDGKYRVSVKREGVQVAWFTFFTCSKWMDEIVFSGMYVEKESRQQGISIKLIEEIFEISRMSNREFIHAHRQKKPLLCRILRRFGFVPIVDMHRNDIAHAIVGRSTSREGAPALHITNPSRRSEWSTANVIRSQGYQLVNSVDQIRDGVGVVLGADYLMQD